MNTIESAFKNKDTLHHAYIIEGVADTVAPELRAFLKRELGVAIERNPDFSDFKFDIFGINEARKLKDIQSTKAFLDGLKIFIITSKSITTEAQNALLKVFEEPTQNTHFFIVLPDTATILPTLRSRVVVLEHASARLGLAHMDDFLRKDISERLLFVEPLCKNKDLEAAFSLLNTIENALYARSAGDMHKMRAYAFALTEIAQCRGHLRGRSPSLKLILEHVSVVTPRIKVEK